MDAQAPPSPLVVAVTGASGAPYARRALQVLLAAGRAVELVYTKSGRIVAGEELGFRGPFASEAIAAWLGCPEQAALLRVHPEDDITASIASGTYRTAGMLVIPCSMATAAAIAHGLSSNLIERAADVTLKEGRPLVVVPRESPMSTLHLRNLLSLAELGVIVAPAAPGFYHHPQSVDDLVEHLVGKVLDRLGLAPKDFRRWTGATGGPPES